MSASVLTAHRRLLDVLRVGEEEAGSLGLHAARVRLVVVAAATLGTAAAGPGRGDLLVAKRAGAHRGD